MNDEEILNRMREAIACLEEATFAIPIEDRQQSKLRNRIQDAYCRLVEAREEMSVRITVQDNARKAIERMSR
jgi:hypothetical protein